MSVKHSKVQGGRLSSAQKALRPRASRLLVGTRLCEPAPEGLVSLLDLASEFGVTIVSVSHWSRRTGVQVHEHSDPLSASFRRRGFLHALDAQTYRAWRSARPVVWSGPRPPVAVGERSVRVAAAELGITPELLLKWLKRNPQWLVSSCVPGAGWNVTDAAVEAHRQRHVTLPDESLSGVSVLDSDLSAWVGVTVLATETGRHWNVVNAWFARRGLSRVQDPDVRGGCRRPLLVAPESALAYRSWAAAAPVSAGRAGLRGGFRRPRRYASGTEVPEGWLSRKEAASFCGCSAETLQTPSARVRYGFMPLSTPVGLRYDPLALLELRSAHAGRRPPEGWVGVPELQRELRCSRDMVRNWAGRSGVEVRECAPLGGTAGGFMDAPSAQAFRVYCLRRPLRTRV